MYDSDHTFKSSPTFHPFRLQIGERVKVVNGAHAGESGMLMHVLEGDRCVLISDISKEEIQVFSR